MANIALASLIFVGGTTALTLLVYLTMRRVAGRRDIEPQTKDLAGSIMTRIAALHGLILALVFAQEMLAYEQLKSDGAIEANAIADVYFDAERFGAGAAGAIQDALYAYVHTVIEQEWPQLDDTGRLMGVGWAEWDKAYSAVLDLVPATERQRSLREHMLLQIRAIATTRVKREGHEAFSISAMFWFAAIAGVVFIALAYYPYPPNRHNLLLISMLGAFTGVILMFIYAFANPYGEPGALQPSAHLRLLDQLDRARGGG